MIRVSWLWETRGSSSLGVVVVAVDEKEWGWRCSDGSLRG